MNIRSSIAIMAIAAWTPGEEAAPAAGGPSAQLRGTWRIVEMQDDAGPRLGRLGRREDAHPAAGAWPKLVVADATCAVYAASGKRVQHNALTNMGWTSWRPADPTHPDRVILCSEQPSREPGAAPALIEYPAIWQLAGDTLRLCWWETPGPRVPQGHDAGGFPTSFASTAPTT